MLLTFSYSYAQEALPTIRVEGVRRIEPDTVKSYLKLNSSGQLDATLTRESIQALFATGFFKDVVIERDGESLVVRVEENPLIDEVTFEGNEAYTTEELVKIIQLKSGSIFDRGKAERDLTALRQGYRIKGLFLANVEMLIKPLNENRMTLVYRVKEGEKSKVREVRFIGNKALSDKELSKALMIKASNWLSWWTDDDTYDREKLLYDQSQLRNLYMDNGYAQVRVDSSVAELTPDRAAFMITHTVFEGERFKFGNIQIEGDFDELPKADLFKELQIVSGEWFSREKLRLSTEHLTDKIGDFGYAFLQIDPRTLINEDEKTVDIQIVVNKGRRVYVNRVEIEGNTRTQDQVIRREVSLVEGNLFSASAMRLSKSRLNALNYFGNVDVTTPAATSADKVDVRIKVEEKPTGTFSVGAGYSTVESLLGTASITQDNFLGRGQRAKLSFTLSSITTDFDFSFTEPYFLDKNMSAGLQLYNRKSDMQSISSYTQYTSGGGINFGFPLSNHLSDQLSYQLSNVEIDDVGSSANLVIQDQAARSPYLQSMVSNSFTWNNLDNKLLPTKGRRHRLTTDLSGLGGDVYFGRILIDNSLFYPFTKDGSWVGHLRGRAGAVESLDHNTVPIFERFFLGGSKSVRGFKSGGLGPRTSDGDAYGGNHFEQVNAELYFPFFGLSDDGLRGLSFVDAGYLGDWDDKSGSITDDGSIRMSAGVGLHWNSPFGPLRFTFAVPILKEDSDRDRVFDFTFGAAL
ncbi:MAG: outer membrane protein assembly factor BamA [Magnetococcus sp. DMHC-6]